MPYHTPFVGLYILPADFVKLCSEFEFYMSQDLVEIVDESVDFPVGRWGEIRIYFMHYQSFEIAKDKWDRRKSRINFSNLGYILVQRDGCTTRDMLKFDSLENPNKVILTSVKDSGLKSAYHLPFFGDFKELGNVLDFKDLYLGRRIMYDFNFSQWIDLFKKRLA